MIRFSCPSCRAAFLVGPELAGMSPRRNSPGRVEVVVANGLGSSGPFPYEYTAPCAVAAIDPPLDPVPGERRAHGAEAPTLAILSCAPPFGPARGRTEVTIRGSGFDHRTTVTIGGVPLASIRCASPSVLLGVTGKLPPGRLDVTLMNGAGAATLAGAFDALPEPSVAAVSPASWPTTGNVTLTITGSGFTRRTRVLIAKPESASKEVSLAEEDLLSSEAGEAELHVLLERYRSRRATLLETVVVDEHTVTAKVPAGEAGRRDVLVFNELGVGLLASQLGYVTGGHVASASESDLRARVQGWLLARKNARCSTCTGSMLQPCRGCSGKGSVRGAQMGDRRTCGSCGGTCKTRCADCRDGASGSRLDALKVKYGVASRPIDGCLEKTVTVKLAPDAKSAEVTVDVIAPGADRSQRESSSWVIRDGHWSLKQ